MQSGRLLILDDDPAIAKAIQCAAEAEGFMVREAGNWTAFFEAIADWCPTHIALDLVMPDMDGVVVLQELAVRGCKAWIVVTGGVSRRVLESAARSGMERGLNMLGPLCNPFSAALLRSMLRGEDLPVPDSKTPSPLLPVLSDRDFQRALGSDEMTLVYQPKVECDTGRLTGFEALLRWDHPAWGIIMPDCFIPAAEHRGYIDALTDRVIHMALKWLADHCGSGANANLSLSLNLSATTLRDLGCVDRFVAACEQHAIPPQRVIFELTETSALEDLVGSVELLTRLRMKGFQLSLDDFGMGYSSMRQLVLLPFNEIKIDKSFVMANHSVESRIVVKSIVDLGRNLGVKTAAEGVETPAAWEFLRHLGCDLAQGYWIGRPMTAAALDEWRTRWSLRCGSVTSPGVRTAQLELLNAPTAFPVA
jgi:EAL domain-containing protein (putative c-di-GMP-specific phosphodiesterase class I)